MCNLCQCLFLRLGTKTDLFVWILGSTQCLLQAQFYASRYSGQQGLLAQVKFPLSAARRETQTHETNETEAASVDDKTRVA